MNIHIPNTENPWHEIHWPKGLKVEPIEISTRRKKKWALRTSHHNYINNNVYLCNSFNKDDTKYFDTEFQAKCYAAAKGWVVAP